MSKKSKAILELGLAFGNIETPSDRWMALIMLITGFAVENVKPENYEEAITDLIQASLANIQAFEEFRAATDLAMSEPEGNA